MKLNIRYRCICFLKRLYFRPRNFLHCFCLGIDVVEYSKRSTEVQLEIIKSIQKVVTSSTALQYVARTDIIFLPTGDGLIICLIGSNVQPTTIIKLAIEIQNRMKERNENVIDEHEIVLRMGVHSGTGSSYIDINSNLNIAGHVANVTQRVTDFAIGWQILASKNAFDDIGTLDNATRELFHYIGFGETKHKQVIALYNVFRLIYPQFGNNLNPPNILITDQTEVTGEGHE